MKCESMSPLKTVKGLKLERQDDHPSLPASHMLKHPFSAP